MSAIQVIITVLMIITICVPNIIKKVAIVTGSNRGIGYGIVKELCRRQVEVVYLTARDVEKGTKAVLKLKKEGYSANFHQLDVTDRKSVQTLANFLKEKHGEFDILISNAGASPTRIYETTYEDAKHVIDVNYKGNLIIQEYIFPFLKDNARVIHIASDCGLISNIKNPYWIKRLTKDNLTVEDINAFVNWFLDSVNKENINSNDFAEMTALEYRVSKIALSALTRVQQKEVKRNISVNCMHPGFTRTDMTKHIGFATVDESSKTPVYLALDIDQSAKGKFFMNNGVERNWTDTTLEHCKLEQIERFLRRAGMLWL